MKRAFLLFWGSNNRAVTTLMRYFTSNNIDFFVVSPAGSTTVENSIYFTKIIYKRIDNILSKELFDNISNQFHGTLIYCPTSEFINTYLLEHQVNDSIETNLIPKSLYMKITSKLDSQSIINNIPNIYIPSNLDPQNIKPPCVFKPKLNTTPDKVLYPHLCLKKTDVEKFYENENVELYFPQEYISGSSYYLCGYLTKKGDFHSYWQKNLLQQENGKSIILAKQCSNPGIEVNDFANKLRDIGFHGPIMMELMKSHDKLFYIEINPRFWGPLQFSLTCNPNLLNSYVEDHGFEQQKKIMPEKKKYYSWFAGIINNKPKNYSNISKEKLQRIAKIYDIYSDIHYKDRLGGA